MAIELTKTIARVRRAMPRNTDVMTICDALEQRLQDHHTKQDRPTVGRSNIPVSTAKVYGEAVRRRQERSEKFDRIAYQREYMRKMRARKKEHVEE